VVLTFLNNVKNVCFECQNIRSFIIISFACHVVGHICYQKADRNTLAQGLHTIISI